MSDENIKFGKNGKPTKETMDYLFRTDRDKFLELQEEYFTTGANMKRGPIDGATRKVMDYVKGKMKKESK